MRSGSDGVTVAGYLDGLTARRQAEGRELLALFEQATGVQGVMWGPGIVGFGTYHYRYESGREGEAVKAGFAPRKQKLVIYVMSGFTAHKKALAKLGKHTLGKSCLYLNKLEDVDLAVLQGIVAKDWQIMSERYDSAPG